MSLPTRMRALVVSDLSEDLSGVSVCDVDAPIAEPGQVLVRIRAGGLGFPDVLMTRGGYQHKPDLPFTPGGDMAGEVVALGEDVSNLAVGDRVVGGKLGGAFAEYGAYPASSLRVIPGHLSFAQAAAVGSAYLTAYVSLVRRADLQAGEWVLVHGAAGGVGLAAVDLARSMGAKVIACASSDDKLAIIEREYSPDVLINTTNGFREQVKAVTGGGADVVYDPVGGDIFDESVRCIGWGGRLLVVGFASGRIPNISVNMPLIKGFSVIGVRAGEYGRKDPQKGRENIETVWKMIGDGQLKPHVHAAHSLDDWRKAFDAMTNREVVGRVILSP